MAENCVKTLVADDNSANRLLLRHILEKEGFSVIEAVDGEDALLKVAPEKIELALLDVMMPRMDGFTLCRLLRQKYSATQLPILFITARVEDSDLAEGFAAGGNDYITKPINITVLLARLRAQVELLKKNQALISSYERIAKQKRLEMVGVFAAGVAHNFNNILGTVLGSSQLIELMSAENEDIKRAAGLIAASARRGARLVEGLLTFARPVSSEICEKPEKQVQSVTEVFCSGSSQPCITLEITGSLPPLALPCHHLTQILAELLSNAIQASRPGKPVVLRAGTTADGLAAKFVIEDKGTGIEQKILDHLFEPFYSTKNTDQFMGIACDGSGLGLATAHNLVSHAGGKIRVLRTGETGTAIEVSIPAAQKP